MLSQTIKDSLEQCVLIWLASIEQDGTPNVSPKEIFAVPDDSTLLIANVASPISVRNIQQNPHVCVSFVNIFAQRGFKLHGLAKVLEPSDSQFAILVQPLEKIVNGLFQIRSVIEIKITRVAPIVAPRYRFYEDTTPSAQVGRAVKRYNRVLEAFGAQLEMVQ